jgi:hypothetical protein
MTTAFLVYKTDNWHNFNSRNIIAVATNQKNAIALCKRQAAKEHQKIDRDQIFNLENYKQTQGYSGDGEFHFEEVPKNTLL